MSSALIAFIGIVYVCVAMALIYEGKPWLAVTFVGYALGNLGLCMVAK